MIDPHLDSAPGRLKAGQPVAIIDIGSNSVRLVAFEGLRRSPTPIFNEKVMCGLGRNVATTGRLDETAMARALSALGRFRILCDIMNVGLVRVLATAAARDAVNGEAFLMAAEQACGVPIDLLSGDREAALSALGVQSGFYKPDGIVGDLGGGSLELIETKGHELGVGTSLQLGGLALQDRSRGDIKVAAKLVRDSFEPLDSLKAMRGKSFYAVGGTWRSLGRLHMRRNAYPLNVMHGYCVPAQDVSQFASMVEQTDLDTLPEIDAVSAARRPLLAYGALVLEQLIRIGRPRQVVFSATGVREGLVYEMLPSALRLSDPLIAAARDLNYLRSRSPRHGEELVAWVDRFFGDLGLFETDDERRLRQAACLLADIGWRAHPDYRSEQSVNIIAHAAFVGIDHPGRAFLSLAVYFRHVGTSDEQELPTLYKLVLPAVLERARLIGAIMRVAYLVSASMPGVLDRVRLSAGEGRIALLLPETMAPLANERVRTRLKQLAKLLGRKSDIVLVEDAEPVS